MDFTPLIVSGTIALFGLAVLFISIAYYIFVSSRELEEYENYKHLKDKYEKERY